MIATHKDLRSMWSLTTGSWIVNHRVKNQNLKFPEGRKSILHNINTLLISATEFNNKYTVILLF